METNVRIIGVPEGKERERARGIFEHILAENFPNVEKETSIHVQEAGRATLKINKNRSTPQNIRVKPANFRDKESLLKAA